MLDRILPAEDKDMARSSSGRSRTGHHVSTGTKVENVDASKNFVKVTYGGEEAEVDYLCIAGGRAPDTEA